MHLHGIHNNITLHVADALCQDGLLLKPFSYSSFIEVMIFLNIWYRQESTINSSQEEKARGISRRKIVVVTFVYFAPQKSGV